MAKQSDAKIILRIKNQTPVIELQSEDDEPKRMITADQGLDTLILQAAQKLGKAGNADDILAELSEGDELFVHFDEPERGEDTISFAAYLEEIDDLQAKYSDKEAEMEGDDEVISQVREYWKLDVISSFIDCVYDELIARTVMAAAAVGTNKVELGDERQEPRLREKMTKELQALEIDFVVS